MNVSALRGFFRWLMHDDPTPSTCILDNLRVHHATLIRDWLAEEEMG